MCLGKRRRKSTFLVPFAIARAKWGLREMTRMGGSLASEGTRRRWLARRWCSRESDIAADCTRRRVLAAEGCDVRKVEPARQECLPHRITGDGSVWTLAP